MAKKKYYATFETREEFTKFIEKAHKSGEEYGFERGLEEGLSYFYDMIRKIESSVKGYQLAMNAQYICHERSKHEWETKQKIRDLIAKDAKEKAVEEYLNSIRI